MAAKGKYNAQIVEEIADLIFKGYSNKGACDIVGITPTTFDEWMNGNVPKAKTDEEKAVFSSAIARAREKRKISLRDHIAAGGTIVVDKDGKKIVEGDWRANAFLLEREFKDEYSLHTDEKITHVLDEGAENASRLVNALIERARGGRKRTRGKP